MTAIWREILPLFSEHLTKIEEEMSPAGTQEPRSSLEGLPKFLWETSRGSSADLLEASEISLGDIEDPRRRWLELPKYHDVPPYILFQGNISSTDLNSTHLGFFGGNLPRNRMNHC